MWACPTCDGLGKISNADHLPTDTESRVSRVQPLRTASC